MLLNVPDTQDSPIAENHLAQNVNRAEAKSPCPKGDRAPEFCPGPVSLHASPMTPSTLVPLNPSVC